MALVATTRIDHDGVTYEKGSVLPQVTEDQARALVEAGAVVVTDDPASAVHPQPTAEQLATSPQPDVLQSQAGQPLAPEAPEAPAADEQAAG